MNSDPLLGRVFHEKYRIDDRLGAGGMATIYRATRLHIGDTVAIKVLHAEVLREPGFAERFRREAQAAARLKHPNVVAIHDFGVPDDLVYLVMELVDGPNLRTIIKDAGPLPAAFAAEITRQVSAALTEAHRQNVVHRDIKPANVAVETTPDGPRVKVLDFGIASLRSGNTFANLTQTGALLGTPAYMSPEQCLGEELDGRSDIYSLGVVLFEMLCGVVPFNSPTPTAVVMQHVQQAPPALRVLNASISPAVEAVVLRALAKRPEDRFHTARDFADALTTAASGPRLSLGPETIAQPRFSASAPDATMMQPALQAPAARPPAAKARTSGILIGLGAALAIALGAFAAQRLLFVGNPTPASPRHGVASVERNGQREKPSTARGVAVRSIGAGESTGAIVHTYYSLWDTHQLREAYGLLSNRYRAEHPYPGWASSHASVVHISVQTAPTSDPMAVAVIVRSIDQTPYGTSSSEYQGTWRAVYENGAKRLDDVALARTR